MKPSFTMFLVNLIVVICTFIYMHRHNVWNDNVAGFAVVGLAWGLALMIQESASNFRIRMLELDKRDLQDQLRKAIADQIHRA